MISIKGGPGHLVRLQEVNDDGLVVDDPYGIVDLEDRVINGKGYEGTKNSIENPTRGNDNLWKWEDIKKGYIVRSDFIIKN